MAPEVSAHRFATPTSLTTLTTAIVRPGRRLGSALAAVVFLAGTLPLFSQGSPTGWINPTVPPYYSGGDYSSAINAALAALPTGGNSYLPPVIYLPPGTYPISSSLTIPAGVTLRGAGEGSTILQATSSFTSGVMVQLGGSGGIEDIAILPYAAGNTLTGLELEGRNWLLKNVMIGGGVPRFHLGILVGPNAFLGVGINIDDEGNDQLLYFPHTSSGTSGENIAFYGSKFSSSATFACGVQLGDRGQADSAEISFDTTSFDRTQVCNNEGMIKGHAIHFEDEGVAADHPVYVGYDSALDGAPGVRSGAVFDATTIFADTTPAGDAWFELNKFASLSLTGLFDTYSGSIGVAMPLVQLGTAVTDAPYLSITDPQNQRNAAALYSIYSGATPTINISTAYVSQHDTAGNTVFTQTSPATPYGQNSKVVFRVGGLYSYTWTGSGGGFYGQSLQPDGVGGGFNVCAAGGFSFTSNDALGTETQTCNGTHLGNGDVTVKGFRLGSGTSGVYAGDLYNLNGTSYIDSWGGDPSSPGTIALYGHSSDNSIADQYLLLTPNGASFQKPIISPMSTPASSSMACPAGEIVVDASYFYVCTATNTWKRVPLTAF